MIYPPHGVIDNRIIHLAPSGAFFMPIGGGDMNGYQRRNFQRVANRRRRGQGGTSSGS